MNWGVNQSWLHLQGRKWCWLQAQREREIGAVANEETSLSVAFREDITVPLILYRKAKLLADNEKVSFKHLFLLIHKYNRQATDYYSHSYIRITVHYVKMSSTDTIHQRSEVRLGRYKIRLVIYRYIGNKFGMCYSMMTVSSMLSIESKICKLCFCLVVAKYRLPLEKHHFIMPIFLYWFVLMLSTTGVLPLPDPEKTNWHYTQQHTKISLAPQYNTFWTW